MKLLISDGFGGLDQAVQPRCPTPGDRADSHQVGACPPALAAPVLLGAPHSIPIRGPPFSGKRQSAGGTGHRPAAPAPPPLCLKSARTPSSGDGWQPSRVGVPPHARLLVCAHNPPGTQSLPTPALSGSQQHSGFPPFHLPPGFSAFPLPLSPQPSWVLPPTCVFAASAFNLHSFEGGFGSPQFTPLLSGGGHLHSGS